MKPLNKYQSLQSDELVFGSVKGHETDRKSQIFQIRLLSFKTIKSFYFAKIILVSYWASRFSASENIAISNALEKTFIFSRPFSKAQKKKKKINNGSVYAHINLYMKIILKKKIKIKLDSILCKNIVRNGLRREIFSNDSKETTKYLMSTRKKKKKIPHNKAI